jgi:hypothetical protein
VPHHYFVGWGLTTCQYEVSHHSNFYWDGCTVVNISKQIGCNNFLDYYFFLRWFVILKVHICKTKENENRQEVQRQTEWQALQTTLYISARAQKWWEPTHPPTSATPPITAASTSVVAINTTTAISSSTERGRIASASASVVFAITASVTVNAVRTGACATYAFFTTTSDFKKGQRKQ